MPSAVPSWKLVNEVGIDYAAPPAFDQPLSFPVVVERALDGSFLIVDEIGLRKNLSVLSECRTLHVDADGKTRFDSVAEGIGDAFGTLIDDGRILLLRRAAWELVVREPCGKLGIPLDLSQFTPHMPRLVSSTSRGTFLVAALDHVYQTDLFEVDAQGRLLWFLPQKDAIGCPTSLQLLSNDHILVADEFGHQALELRRDGSVAWHYGERRHPSKASDKLSNPMAATEAANGVRLLSDTRNHRIVEVTPDGVSTRLQLGTELSSPTFASRLSDGHLAVCDAGNQRVLVFDEEGQLSWQYGDAISNTRSLSFPRSVEVLPDGRYLVADTGYDRVVTLTPSTEPRAEGRVAVWPVQGSPLFWPRCVRTSHTGDVVIADGRNSRIVALSTEGVLVKELTGFDHDQRQRFKDPHDVRPLPDGALLVTDASLGAVVEVDWDGRLQWIADGDSAGLKDPHSAQRLGDGHVLISDSGNGRLVWADASGAVARELASLRQGSYALRLDHPRYAEITPDGILLIVDSGNNRVLAATPEGDLIWELSEIPCSRLPRLSRPRWAQMVGRDEVIVSDHSNHRILRLRRENVGNDA